MKEKVKTKTFNVTARLGLEVNIEISASSLEDAVQKSKNLTHTDFVDILGDFNDGEMKINGVFETYSEIKL